MNPIQTTKLYIVDEYDLQYLVTVSFKWEMLCACFTSYNVQYILVLCRRIIREISPSAINRFLVSSIIS